MTAAARMTLRLIVQPAADGAEFALHRLSGESLSPAVRLPVDWIWVRDVTRRVRRVQARACHHAGGNERDLAELHERTALLANHLLPPEIRTALPAQAGTGLCLQISGVAQEVPWEILPVGGRPLGLLFAVGRVSSDDDVQNRDAASCLSHPDSLRIGLAINPEFNLPGTVTEADALCRLFDTHDLSCAVIQKRHRVTRDDLTRLIEESDWLHFAGHAEVTSAGVAWKLADGCWTAEDWEQAAPRRRTRFLFAHACSSAAIPAESAGTPASDLLGAARIHAGGVRHVLGTVVPISDHHANEFSECFYREILARKTIGEAVRLARCRLVDEHRAAGLLWSVYLLHGPPDETLLTDDIRGDD